MGINQNTKPAAGDEPKVQVILPRGAVWAAVKNLHDTAIMLPGRYYGKAIPAKRVAKFPVRDFEEFASDLQVLQLVGKKLILIKQVKAPAAEQVLRPPVQADASSPNVWERQAALGGAPDQTLATDRVWPPPGRNNPNPRNPEEQRVANAQKALDAAMGGDSKE